MGRPKTPGSQVDAPTPPAQPSSTVSNVEAQWFNPPVARMQPVGGDLEHRRGWRPSRSHGMGFVIVSVLLLGVAGAGTFFFLGPDGQTTPARMPAPVSTTSITNAEALTPPSPDRTPPLVRAITPVALPNAPPSVNAVKAPSPSGWHPNQKTPAPLAQTPPPLAPAEKPPAKGLKATGELPDLDRAAAAAGLAPSEEDVFSTPGTASENTPAPPAPATTTTTRSPAPPAGSDEATTPAPSEVAPDLEIKR